MLASEITWYQLSFLQLTSILQITPLLFQHFWNDIQFQRNIRVPPYKMASLWNSSTSVLPCKYVNFWNSTTRVPPCKNVKFMKFLHKGPPYKNVDFWNSSTKYQNWTFIQGGTLVLIFQKWTILQERTLVLKIGGKSKFKFFTRGYPCDFSTMSLQYR